MKFCNKCGSRLINGVCPTCSKSLKKSMKKNNKKHKILISLLILIALGFSGTFLYLKVTSKSESEIALAFSNSISSSKPEELSKILYCYDSSLPINKSNSNILIDYLTKNPSKFSSINEAFKNGEYKNTNSPLSIEEVRKDFFLIPVYKVVVKPSFVKVNTDLKDLKVSCLDNNLVDISEKKELGPLMPGSYNIHAEVSNSYINKSEDIPVNTFKDSNQEITPFKNFVKVNISSDMPNAELYVNNKDTGLTVKEAKNLDPIDPNSIIYAIAKDGDKNIISNKYDIENSKNIDINFASAKATEANFQKELYYLLKNYSEDFAYAVNADNFNYIERYLEFDGPLYKKQKRVVPYIHNQDIKEKFESTEILNYTFNNDTDLGEVTCNEIYSVAQGVNIAKRQEFKNVYTFKRLPNGSLVLVDLKE